MCIPHENDPHLTNIHKICRNKGYLCGTILYLPTRRENACRTGTTPLAVPTRLISSAVKLYTVQSHSKIKTNETYK